MPAKVCQTPCAAQGSVPSGDPGLAGAAEGSPTLRGVCLAGDQGVEDIGLRSIRK